MTSGKVRCPWAGDDAAKVRNHHQEGGFPAHDDRHLFEILILEVAVAGMTWSTILRKREAYRRAFDGFDPAVVARYDAAKVARLLADAGIVRNKLKIAAAIGNARAFQEVQRAEGSFDRLLWSFVGGRPKVNRPRSPSDVPARTAESDALSKELLKRGFKFVGSTIVYALMQACGLVNEHVRGCFRAKPAGKTPTP